MIKKELVDRIRSETKVPERVAQDSVETILSMMKATLARHERIELRGLGTFRVQRKKTGIGRNPKTGIPIVIKPGKTVKFRVGSEIRQTLVTEE